MSKRGIRVKRVKARTTNNSGEKIKSEHVKIYKSKNGHAYAVRMAEQEEQKLEKKSKPSKSSGSKVLCHKDGTWVVKKVRPGGTSGGGGTNGRCPKENSENDYN